MRCRENKTNAYLELRHFAPLTKFGHIVSVIIAQAKIALLFCLYRYYIYNGLAGVSRKNKSSNIASVHLYIKNRRANKGAARVFQRMVKLQGDFYLETAS